MFLILVTLMTKQVESISGKISSSIPAMIKRFSNKDIKPSDKIGHVQLEGHSNSSVTLYLECQDKLVSQGPLAQPSQKARAPRLLQ